MANQVETLVLGDGLKFELQDDMSRANETIISGAGVIPMFRVLGRITASGLLTSYDPAAVNGAQNACAVAAEAVDATAAARAITVIDWTAIFALQRLNYGAGVTTQAHRDTAIAALKARGVRIFNQA